MLKEKLHFFLFSIHDYSNNNLHYTCPGMVLDVRG